ncbi:24634_t:CDS:2, partial [Gigaspora rosea]
IAHAIKRYVHIGCDVVEGSDIVSATQNLAGTHLANIEPNRNQTTNPSENLEAGMADCWPISGVYCGTSIAAFWSSSSFSPAIIANLCNEELLRPQPKISTHTEPPKKWTMTLSNPQVLIMIDINMGDKNIIKSIGDLG